MNEIKTVVNTNYGLLENPVIAEYTATSSVSSISFSDLNILPGEKYIFRIIGTASANADVYIRFNGFSGAYYFQMGTYSSGTLTANGTYTPNYIYRTGETGFRVGAGIRTQLTTIEGTIEIRYNINNSRNCPFFTWKSQCLWNGVQFLSDMIGIYGQQSVDTITDLSFTPNNSATFSTGTKVQLIKVNNTLTI